MPDNDPIIYRYRLEWSIYDSVGNRIRSEAKLTQTLEEAKKDAQRLKRDTPMENNIIVKIRKLDNDEIVEQYKKSAGMKNYRRRNR